jgi:tetratricopeptide (TPR) repeat protein
VRNIDVEEFVRRLRAETNADKRFALFLGAGCSVTSGIPAAGALVRDRWIPRLRDFEAPHRSDVEAWAKEVIEGHDPENPGLSYGKLIDRLFLTPFDRQREIEDLCDGRTPSFGYAVLAQLVALQTGRFNIVLTTNFDDLIADALYLYTEARPLVIHHESLAAFIRPTRTRPLIVKLHGDHRLSPRNTALETQTLEQEIQRHTAMVLHDRGVIFMGYGGADTGILKMLNDLPTEALPYGAYWVHPQEPQGKVLEWLERRQGVWVRSGWFDEVMLLIRNAFDLPHPGEERFTLIFQNYQQKFQELSAAIQQKPAEAPGVQALQKALTDTEALFPDYWKAISEARRLEHSDPDRAEQVYQQGATQFPNAGPLLGSYAHFLKKQRKDNDAAEAMYKRALEADPKNATNLGSYALFLENQRKDNDLAEAMYKRTLEANPKNATNLGNYAVFLENQRKDNDAAEAMYKRALEADPKNATNLGNFAVFLRKQRKDNDAAEAMYKRALEADPKNANNLGNYALFLNNERKGNDDAEAMYKRALEADPKNGNMHANLAQFLLAAGRSEGLVVLHEALALLHENPHPVVELECAFYLFAHGSEQERAEGLKNARRLIESGIRSPGWDLSRNVERARQDGHPEGAWLGELAEVINDDAQPQVLNDWPAWRSAAA